MTGVKIYNKPQDVESVLRQWRRLRIDTAFIGPKLRAERTFIRCLKEEDITIFAIFPVFYDRQWLQTHPEDYALAADGSRAMQEWVHFACLSADAFLAHKLADLADVIETVAPDRVSLDFIRFFVLGEKVSRANTGNLAQTCFNERCLHRFEIETGVILPNWPRDVREKSAWILGEKADAWAVWKCAVIEKTVELPTAEIRGLAPSTIVGLHAALAAEGLWRRCSVHCRAESGCAFILCRFLHPHVLFAHAL